MSQGQDTSANKKEKREEDEKVRSPSVLSQSSVTSAALEWDHTADIGKYKVPSGKDDGANSDIGDISTIERMAIHQSSDRVNRSASHSKENKPSTSKVERPSSYNKALVLDKVQHDERRSKSESSLSKAQADDNVTSEEETRTLSAAEKKRLESHDLSILEKGAWRLFKKRDNDMVIESKESSNSDNSNDSDTGDTERHRMSDVNKSETGDSQYADASESPFEDKNPSSQFTDAHESAVDEMSNSEFVDAEESTTAEPSTSELTKYTNSESSKKTGSESMTKSNDYPLHTSPTYTVLNNGHRKKVRSKERPSMLNSISSSEASDHNSSHRGVQTDSRPGGSESYFTSAVPHDSDEELRMKYRTSSPIQPNTSYNIHDSRSEQGDTSDENQTGNKSRRFGRGKGVSDASTDWEYGNENSKSEPITGNKSIQGGSTNSENGSFSRVSNRPGGRSSSSQQASYPSGVERTHSSLSASEWQTSGVTRSELEYKKRIANSTSTGTSSVVWLELLANEENDLSGDPRLLKLKNRGVQTNAATSTKLNKRVGPGDNKIDDSSSDKDYSMKPKPHHSTSHHHKKPQRREERPRVETTSSSDLSPACKFVEQIVKASPVKPKRMLKVIDEHRYYHAVKVEKDLRHLHRLVKMIHGSKDSPPSSSHPSTSTADETDSSLIRKCVQNYKDNRDRKRDDKCDDDIFKKPHVPLNKRVMNKQCQTSVLEERYVKRDPRDKINLRSTYKDNTRSYSSSTKQHHTNKDRHCKPSVQATIPLNKKKEVEKAPYVDIINERIDHLSSKFDTLADLLILSQEMTLKKEIEREKREKKYRGEEREKNRSKNVKQSSRKNEKENVPPRSQPKPIKPPVCFFVPFPNRNGSPYDQANIKDERLQRKIVAERRNLKESPTFETIDENRREVDGEYHNDQDDALSNSDEDEKGAGSSNDQNLQSLQEAFERYHAEFIARTRQREAILSQLKSEREMRAEMKREWIRKYGECVSDASVSLEKQLPPKGPRVMTHKEMKQITAKNYKKAMEVQEKNVKRKHEQEKRTNRLMSQVFARKLRQKALRGDVNILHSTSLIRR